ncbi:MULTISPECIES: DUF1187 family protein [Enterobacter]|uniref:DUF1187 family protein n=1 Tax=Enterobacter TaxID=547 RepID=UPI000902027C|nr:MULTISPECIES: DUF1187 family protein [Enterobacter]EKS6337852.1 DUF1187 family protein [Enterobacter hormaechei]
MYKITATIIKPGNPETTWTRYSSKKLTLEQCEALFYTPKEFRSPFDEKIKVENFLCEKID